MEKSNIGQLKISISKKTERDMNLLFPKSLTWNERIKVLMRSINPLVLEKLHKVKDRCIEENKDFDTILRDEWIKDNFETKKAIEYIRKIEEDRNKIIKKVQNSS